jgi:hypothetical protein
MGTPINQFNLAATNRAGRGLCQCLKTPDLHAEYEQSATKRPMFFICPDAFLAAIGRMEMDAG